MRAVREQDISGCSFVLPEDRGFLSGLPGLLGSEFVGGDVIIVSRVPPTQPRFGGLSEDWAARRRYAISLSPCKHLGRKHRENIPGQAQVIQLPHLYGCTDPG